MYMSKRNHIQISINVLVCHCPLAECAHYSKRSSAVSDSQWPMTGRPARLDRLHKCSASGLVLVIGSLTWFFGSITMAISERKLWGIENCLGLLGAKLSTVCECVSLWYISKGVSWWHICCFNTPWVIVLVCNCECCWCNCNRGRAFQLCALGVKSCACCLLAISETPSNDPLPHH